MKTTIKELESVCHTLSKPSKMPCHSYNTSTTGCRVGSTLVNVPGSVCFGCYAMKGNYTRYPAGERARLKRLKAIRENLGAWEKAITELIRRKEKSGFFRWHDAGDIQGILHLEAINRIALALPDIRFWLPTRELSTVAQFAMKHGKFASNLVVRLSALKVKGIAPASVAKRLGVNTSTVGWKGTRHTCPASAQGNECKACRACWQSSVANVDYPFH